MNFTRSSIWLHSCQGILLSSQKALLCNPCLRNELSPFSQEGQCPQIKGLLQFRLRSIGQFRVQDVASRYEGNQRLTNLSQSLHATRTQHHGSFSVRISLARDPAEVAERAHPWGRLKRAAPGYSAARRCGLFITSSDV